MRAEYHDLHPHLYDSNLCACFGAKVFCCGNGHSGHFGSNTEMLLLKRDDTKEFIGYLLTNVTN